MPKSIVTLEKESAMRGQGRILQLFAVSVMVSCGQAPSFVDNGHGASPAGTNQIRDDDVVDGGGESNPQPDGNVPPGNDQPGTTVDTDNTDDSVDVVVVNPPVPTTPVPNNNGGNNTVPVQPQPTVQPAKPVVFNNEPSNPSSPTFVIPDLKPDEVNQVAACIKKWKKVPFTGTFTNVKRIKAAVSVFGIGNAINDTQQTSTPALILVDAGVNVMGQSTYNMLNDKGYYCMKVNVNVMTELDVNLACNAKLADNSVQVNVGSDTNATTGMIGVNVGATVNVERMTPNKQMCAN